MQHLFFHGAIFIALFLPQYFVSANAMYAVSPLVIDEEVEARDIIQKTITLTNTGAQPVTVYPAVNNISLQEGGTIDEFLPPVSSDRTQSLASWIEISRLGINLQSGESREIPLTLRINPSPVPGTYHALVGFGTGRNRDEAEAMIKAGQAPGTVITVTIVEKKNEVLKLSGFVVDRFVTQAVNQGARYTFRNPGDEVLVPKGEIIFYDKTGKEVATASVNDENVSIPPGGEHVFETQVPVGGLFGKYKAFLSVEYGTTQRASVQDTSFFYVLPLKVIIGILAILILIVAVSAWHVHRKYFDEDTDDSERLMVHVRDGQSDPLHHDIDLKKS
jgi:hypothetical protein